MAERDTTRQPAALDQPMRLARRAEARRRRRRRHVMGGAATAAVVLLAVVVAVLAGSGSGRRGSRSTPVSKRAEPVVAGGPLAPAAVGGLAALWAPQNVVGSEP